MSIPETPDPKTPATTSSHDPRELAHELREHYPQGLPGEREQLVTEFMNRGGMNHHDAVQAAEALHEAGYAHHLPGESSRWMFTSESVPLRDLMAHLDENYDGYVGESDQPREQMLGFITAHMNIDPEVAEEVLVGLERAGYTSVAYHPESQRDRMRMAFPEAFRLVA
ncbi:hypothetical protein BH24DEI2_BH24DEI2_18650 [soil metagenome]